MSTPTRAKKESARDKLLHAAATLFYNNGIAATGIDSIVKKADVAKKSLYNNFASKSDLIAAYIESRHAEWLSLYAQRLQQATTPTERVLAVFDAYTDHADDAYERGFRGCGLLNAAAEFPAGDTARLAVRAHKEDVEALLQQHVAELLPEQPERSAALAQHLAFLLEGAMVRAGLEGHSACSTQARTIAAALLENL